MNNWDKLNDAEKNHLLINNRKGRFKQLREWQKSGGITCPLCESAEAQLAEANEFIVDCSDQWVCDRDHGEISEKLCGKDKFCRRCAAKAIQDKS